MEASQQKGAYPYPKFECNTQLKKSLSWPMSVQVPSQPVSSADEINQARMQWLGAYPTKINHSLSNIEERKMCQSLLQK